jgi:acyl-CoA synthetase (AMP-forming)/AMP-acid ligase II
LARIIDQLKPFAVVGGIPSVAEIGTLCRFVAPGVENDASISNIAAHSNQPHDLALIQYTSGSTSAPKGCALSHRAMLWNAQALVSACDVREGDEGVVWVPFHHDMGLMSGVVVPVVGGASTCLLSPNRFIASPFSWLDALAKNDRTHTAVPNSALALTLKRLELKGAKNWDFSNVASLMCGAEPIDPALVRRFFDALVRCHLDPSVFVAAYGMSECTVLATCRGGAIKTNCIRVDDAARATDDRCHPDREIVSVGSPPPDGEFRIVSAEGIPVREGIVGHVQLRSPSLMDGYYGNLPATAAAIEGGWLKTGDVGFALERELYITGRSSEIIIVAGRNIHPSDVENAIARDLDIPEMRIAVFGAPGDLGTDAIHVLIEHRSLLVDSHIENGIRNACLSTCGTAPASIAVSPPGAIPRTTSGKKKRHALTAKMDAI